MSLWISLDEVNKTQTVLKGCCVIPTDLVSHIGKYWSQYDPDHLT